MPNDNADVWDALAERLDAFLAAWDGGEQPDIAEFLTDSGDERRLLLIELIKADMEMHAERGLGVRRIEEYITRFPELGGMGVAVDLLHEEYHLRKRSGAAVSFDEYQKRFPEAAAGLARLIGTGSGSATTSSSAPRVELNVQPGDTIADFQILRLLGEGAFAKVFLAWQSSLQRTVAIKVSADRGMEPQTLAQLDHPNIVRVFDQRLVPERGLRLLYMTFVAGGSLAAVLADLKTISRPDWSGQSLCAAIDRAAALNSPTASPLHALNWPQTVMWLGARVAAALDYAHGRGVLHRDVKPANILLTPGGEPLLADFNVGAANLKEPGPAAQFGGSFAYMAPEHLEAFDRDHSRRPDEVDSRCDIFALGVTLWEMLTGARPFPDEQAMSDRATALPALVALRRAGVPLEARDLLPHDCPAALVEVLVRCLAPDPQTRFASAGELARALNLCLHPRTQALMRPAPRGWTAFARRHPLLVMVPLGLAPNVFASILNVQYNQAAVIDARPDAQGLFQTLILIINGLFFPAGIALFVVPAWPVATSIRRIERGAPIADDERRQARRRCLQLGTLCSLACVASWLAAGVTWPLALDVLGGVLPWQAHLHFLISLTLCGLSAAVYPFFLVSFVAVRGLLPTLLRGPPPESAEHVDLARLDRALVRNLALAAAVPLVGLAALVSIDSQDRASMRALTIMGLAGCAFAYFLERRVRADMEALTQLYPPRQ